MSVPNAFTTVSNATGAQLDANFAACAQLNAANTLANQLNYAPSVTLASAASVAIGAASSNNIIISGAATITAFDTIAEGALRHVTYSGTVAITYNVTSMQLIGGANRTYSIGDYSIFRSLGGGNWVEEVYQPIGGTVALAKASTLSNQLNWAPTVTIPSASSVAIGAAASNNITISGTATVTAFDTIAEGAIRHVTYSGAVPITYNVTSMQLIGGGSRVNSAGDVSIFRSLGSGNWVEEFYQPTAGQTFSAAQDFRLTLTSATPVTTADVTGAITIYCTPYKGKIIALWTGTAWQNYISNEFSIALGTLVSGKAYDVFCYQNAGIPTLELGTAWTNDTTRSVALAYQNGILVKSGDATRRYLGTFYTTSTTTTEDSVANRYLWNYYNRVARQMKRRETTATWNYTTATIRQANANTANQLNFIIGSSEDIVRADLCAHWINTAGSNAATGIGLDSTTTFASDGINSFSASPANNDNDQKSSYAGLPGVGRHFLTWLEYSAALGTCTWTGTPTSTIITGLNGTILG